MITINIVELEDHVSVRVNRWRPGDRYPSQLAWECIPVEEGESELALAQRAAKVAAWACQQARFSESPLF